MAGKDQGNQPDLRLPGGENGNKILGGMSGNKTYHGQELSLLSFNMSPDPDWNKTFSFKLNVEMDPEKSNKQ